MAIKENSIVIVSKGYAMEPSSFFPHLNAGVGDPKLYLTTPKSRKFMGKQDLLSVTALGRALETTNYQGHRSGIYMSVGYIPFEKDILENIARLSSAGTKFSMNNFVKDAVSQLNPLLTFRCLPNMPVYHCSVNFNITGAYYVTHPSIGEFYQCLIRAIADLKSNRVDCAMVGACADMNNFLVTQCLRMKKLNITSLTDSAAFIILKSFKREEINEQDVIYTLSDFNLTYNPKHHSYSESFNRVNIPIYPGSPSLALSLCGDDSKITHHGTTETGYIFKSKWERP